MHTELGGSQVCSQESSGVASNVAEEGEMSPGQEREQTCQRMVHTSSEPLFTSWDTMFISHLSLEPNGKLCESRKICLVREARRSLQNKDIFSDSC